MRNKLLVFVLLLICARAAVRVATPFYENYRDTRDKEINRFRPSARVQELLNNASAPAATLNGQYPCVSADVTDAKPRAQLGLCGAATRHSGPVDEMEADFQHGNFVLRQSDLYINDVFDVPLTRTYNSGDWISQSRMHAFGRNTSHPYDIAPVGTRYPYTYQWLVFEDGDFVYFPRVSQGTSYDDAIFQQTETSGPFYKAVTAWNGDGWNTFRTDGQLFIFPEAYNSKNAAQGAPYEMRNAAGDRLLLQRDGDRNLVEILTPHKHWIKMQNDDGGRITRADDDQGHWATYKYDSLGTLTDAVSSSGHARHYTYDGNLMTQIEDENHQVLLRNVYSGDFLVGQKYGNGEVFLYRYVFAPSRYYVESVEVTLPDGTKAQVDVASSISDVLKNPPPPTGR